MSKTTMKLFYRSHETPDFVRWFETDTRNACSQMAGITGCADHGRYRAIYTV